MTDRPDRAVMWYALLLRAFPRSYREENAAELIDFFRERHEEQKRLGRRAVAGYLMRASWDVVREGLAERLAPSSADVDAMRLAPESSGKRSLMNGLSKDITHSFRAMRRAPGWTALIITTIGLGIGASTVIFTMFDAVLLRPLPFAAPARLVSIETFDIRSGEGASSNLADFSDWRAAQSFSAMAAYDDDVLTVTVKERPERVLVGSVSPEYFSVLGVAPALGRSFVTSEGVYGNHRVAILRHDFWATRLGSDSSAIGQSLAIGGVPFTIIGVMPEGWPGAWSSVSVWRPLSFAADDWRVADRGSRWMAGTVGRLRPGVSVAAADAELRAIGASLAREHRESNQNHSVRGQALRAAITADARTPLRALFGAVSLLLLIGCVNVANMLLARATARAREVGVRRALGASRLRLARLALVESLVLGLCGGVLGVVVTRWLLTPAVLLAGDRFPGLGTPQLDVRVLVFALLATLITALGFGLAPVVHGWRADIQNVLREGRAALGNRRTQRALRTLTTVQMAVAVTLLTGAGLLIRSFDRQSRIDLGFEAEDVLAFQVSVLIGTYPNDTARLAFLDQLRGRLATLPGVQAAAVTFQEAPLTGGDWWTTFGVEGRPVPANPADRSTVRFGTVTGDYFAALKVRAVRGRTLTPADDRPGAPRVAVISERLAQRHFPNQNPVGQRLWLFDPKDMSATIVGVVTDVRAEGARIDPVETVYVPAAQTTHGVASTQWYLLRTIGDPTALTEAVREAVRAVDRGAAIDRMGPLTQVARDALAPERFNTILVGMFAGLAVLLAAVGLYGVMSYSIAQQRRDIGVRLALGARPRDAVKFVLVRAFAMVAIGLGIGIVTAVWLGHVLAGLLFAVEPFDPATLLGVTGTLVLVALAAAIVPARNAARVAPAEAMRAS